MSFHFFAIKVKNHPDAVFCAEQSAKRASGPGIHKLFADWVIFQEKKSKEERTYFVGVESVFPDIWKFGAVATAVPFLIAGFSWTGFMIPGMLIWLSSFLVGNTSRYITFKISLRRYGYNGPITRINGEKIITEMLKKRRDRWLKTL